MKKIFLSIVGFSMICRFSAFAQTKEDTSHNKSPFTLYQPVKINSDPAPDDYNPRALRIDEINLVSSYYWQRGDHSAITGGIGTEKVSDISNGLDLKLAWNGDNQNKNTISLGLGLDHHTSASSAFVTTTGLGKQGGTRIYPSFDWTVENSKTGNTFGIGTYYSGEYNYKSLGADVHFSKKTADKNGEFSFKLQAYLDHVTLIYPSELVKIINPAATSATYITTASGNVVLSNGASTIPTKPRDTYTASFGYSQIINSRLQIMFLADVVAQHGYLSLPFHRVYFYNAKGDSVEKLPSSRFKLPLGFRANYFLGDNIILRSYYRYYLDNWGTRANTASLEIAYKVSPFFSISPFYRYYTQTAARYFAPYGEHSVSDEYYTSNYEYAKFNSQFFGVGFRVAPPKGVFGWHNLHELEIRYGHYAQNTDLVSDVVSLSLGFK
ncbi:uncharacterized protein DUF3570 [Mucilaginibacter frigoritolerans]|uniref:Uncharacterized protein DUF3570 n=1 Tax=Mucilaginibacter frigoritolerans TaxID=652788 RepID=A0A562TQ74_9SPHI|nr:DUF3570 domain-containing protein [Mucilaginibacter frigoritolerans]TWI95583.1 uncharacterized protein DUF3570 [Mucilaginibacter frigoritolerans]